MAEKSLVSDVALMLAPVAVSAAAVVAVDELDWELLHAARPATPMTSSVSAFIRLSEALMLPARPEIAAAASGQPSRSQCPGGSGSCLP
jgi:hypothetical protein